MFRGSKKDFFVFARVFLAIILVVSGSYFVWDRYLSEGGKAARLFEEQTKLYEEMEKAYIEAMTADTYGGKTPQETLDLFVAALEKDDIELASKYFMLDENLSREKWATYLKNIEKRNLLNKMAEDIDREAKSFGVSEKNRFSYALFNNNNVVEILISMRLNEYSQVWKIESL